MAPQSGPEIRQLRAFVTLVERGGVTAAARALDLAQSTVSEAVAALERSLGAQLVVRARGGDGARLTAAGEALVPHARAILVAVDHAHAAIAAATRSARARVEIVANESTSTYILPAALTALRARWPMTRFSVSVAACSSVRECVAGGTFDVGLLLEWDASPEPDEGRILLGDVPLVVFAQPSHPLAQSTLRRPVARAELAESRVFVTDATGDFHAAVHRFFTQDRLGASTLEATGSVEGVKRAVAANADALGVLPAFAVVEELRSRAVVRLEVRPALPRMQLAARLSPGHPRHPAVDELIEALRRPRDASIVRRIS